MTSSIEGITTCENGEPRTTYLSQEECYKLRECCYSLFSPKIADDVAKLITEAMGTCSTMNEYSLATTMMLFLEQCKDDNGAPFAYQLCRISQSRGLDEQMNGRW